MARQYLIRGAGFVLEGSSGREYLIRGAYVNEKSTVFTGTIHNTTTHASQHLSATEHIVASTVRSVAGHFSQHATGAIKRHRQYLIRNIGFINETTRRQYLLRGGALINESSGYTVFDNQIHQTITHATQQALGQQQSGGHIANRISFSQSLAGQATSSINRRQYLIRGGAFINSTGTRQWLIRGCGLVNERNASAATSGVIRQSIRFSQSAYNAQTAHVHNTITHASQHAPSFTFTGGARISQVLGQAFTSFVAAGVGLNGATYLHRAGSMGLPEESDGFGDVAHVMASLWFMRDGLPPISEYLIGETGQKIEISLDTFGKIQVVLASAADPVFAFITDESYCDGIWHHLLISADVSTEAGTKVGQIAIDGNLAASTILSDAYGAFDIDLTQNDWFIGARAGAAATNLLTGSIAEPWVQAGDSFDLSDPDIIAKFWNAGAPVNLGEDGSLPTELPPLVYLHLGQEELLTNFAVNRGYGGDFTIVGTLTTAPDLPVGPPTSFQSIITQQALSKEVLTATIHNVLTHVRSAGIGPGVSTDRHGTIAQHITHVSQLAAATSVLIDRVGVVANTIGFSQALTGFTPIVNTSPVGGWKPRHHDHGQTADARRRERERLGIVEKQQRAIDRAAVKIAKAVPMTLDGGLLAGDIRAMPAFETLLAALRPSELAVAQLVQSILDRMAWMQAEQEEEEAVIRIMMEMD